MRGWFRLNAGNWLTGGLHVLILVVAAQAENAAVWPFALALMALVSFAAWVGNYRRLRHMADTPTSRIASAAQGYVEFQGAAGRPPGPELASKLGQTPCVWFRYQIEKKGSNNKWSFQGSGESDDLFEINDGSGRCLVDPSQAEIVTTHRRSWTTGSFRYTEWLLLPQEITYAIGEFATVGGATALDAGADVSALLTDWKIDQPKLLERFDLDRSGALDVREWDLARRQARREVEARHAAAQTSEGTHVMRKPRDGRLYLLSNYLPDRLERRYRLWCWAHLAIFFGAGTLSATLF